MFSASFVHGLFSFFKRMFSPLTPSIAKEKSTKTNPSSSVGPGTFVFCQQVFPLKRFHGCFPYNIQKLYFNIVLNTLSKEMKDLQMD